MIKLKLHTKYYASKPEKELILYISTNVSLSEVNNDNKPDIHTCINEGTHNNGGWNVVETIDEIEKMIDDQLKGKA